MQQIAGEPDNIALRFMRCYKLGIRKQTIAEDEGASFLRSSIKSDNKFL